MAKIGELVIVTADCDNKRLIGEIGVVLDVIGFDSYAVYVAGMRRILRSYVLIGIS
jgi:hypothetical protein